MSTKHSKTEQETVILYNQEDKTATICTEDPALMRKLDNLSGVDPRLHVRESRNGYREYEVPKKWVRVSKPREMTDEQRQLSGERMKRLLEAKKAREEGQGEAVGSS